MMCGQAVYKRKDLGFGRGIYRKHISSSNFVVLNYTALYVRAYFVCNAWDEKIRRSNFLSSVFTIFSSRNFLKNLYVNN